MTVSVPYRMISFFHNKALENSVIGIWLLEYCKDTKAAIKTCSKDNNTVTNSVITFITQLS